MSLELDQLPDEEFLEIALYSVFEGLEVDIKPTKRGERRKTAEIAPKDLPDVDLNLEGLSPAALDKLLKSLEGGELISTNGLNLFKKVFDCKFVKFQATKLGV